MEGLIEEQEEEEAAPDNKKEEDDEETVAAIAVTEKKTEKQRKKEKLEKIKVHITESLNCYWTVNFREFFILWLYGSYVSISYL